jgi:hypothetical protein
VDRTCVGWIGKSGFGFGFEFQLDDDFIADQIVGQVFWFHGGCDMVLVVKVEII